MKLIIAGSRNLNPTIQFISSVCTMLVFDKLGAISEEVCGEANGVDSSGKNYAIYMNIPVKKFSADWEKYGKSAGPRRNKEMAKYADALLLIWDGKSKGSKNMKEEMLKLKKPIYEVILTKHE